MIDPQCEMFRCSCGIHLCLRRSGPSPVYTPEEIETALTVALDGVLPDSLWTAVSDALRTVRE